MFFGFNQLSELKDLETLTPTELIETADTLIDGSYANTGICVDLLVMSQEQSLAAKDIGDVVASSEYFRAWLDISDIARERRG